MLDAKLAARSQLSAHANDAVAAPRLLHAALRFRMRSIATENLKHRGSHARFPAFFLPAHFSASATDRSAANVAQQNGNEHRLYARI